MDLAKCIIDDVVYTAVSFSKLPLGELSQKRRSLICDECGGPAFFRRASRSGQAACFGARPHAEGCSLAAPESDRDFDDSVDQQDELNNPGSVIVLDLNFGTAPTVQSSVVSSFPKSSSGRGAFTGGGEREDAVMRRRLSTMLRNLVKSEQFGSSAQVIDVSGVGRMPVQEFFVPFIKATEDFHGRSRGYWGMVSDARFDRDGTLWLNSGGRASLSVCIDKGLVEKLYSRFSVPDEDSFSGCYVLVIGELRVSSKGKVFVGLTDIELMALRDLAQ